MSLEYRPYQHEAVDAALSAFSEHRSALLVLPTGTGKTVIFAHVAEKRRALVLAHREELIGQACDKIQAWTPLMVAVEMAHERAAGSLADVVVASVQALSQPSRLGRFHPDEFGLVVVDEGHHAPAPTYRRILDHFAGAKVLGVTATPDRLDGSALGQVFEAAPFVHEIRDAIEDGWLCPIRQRAVYVQSLDLSRVRTTAGDLNEGDLEAALLAERPLHEVAEPLIRLATDRKTLVFAATVAHAQALAAVMGRYAGPARVRATSGRDTRDDRRQALADFSAGRAQFLVNCLLFTEGFDLPAIDGVAVVRPTKSRALYAQMIGRGTRVAPGKADLLVLDFRGNAGRHRLVSTFDVLDGTTDPAVQARAQRIMDSHGLPVHLAVDEVNRQIAEQQRAQMLTVGVEAMVRDVDPFTILGVHVPAGRWGGLPPTDRQREVLERNGINSGGFDKGQASGLIAAIIERREHNLCTYRQAKTLARFGLNPDVSFEEARALIEEIAANGWRRPSGLMPWVPSAPMEAAT